MGGSRRWVCGTCKARKSRCDGGRPKCSTCRTVGKQCVYTENSNKPRPHKRHQKRPDHGDGGIGDRRSDSISSLGAESPSILPSTSNALPAEAGPSHMGSQRENNTANDVDVEDFLARDDTGQVLLRGHTNTLYAVPRSSHEGSTRESQTSPSRSTQRNSVSLYYVSAELTANAALSRQREQIDREKLMSYETIEGIPVELIYHLLDLHWSRHHFFHLTYRPAFMRELVGGLLKEPGFKPRYFSMLLFYAILATACRYSERPSLRSDPKDPKTAGSVFYDRAKKLVIESLGSSSISSAVALLLMGNALVSTGDLDLGWMYTGMGIRMLTNIGLQVDSANFFDRSAEDIEISRRVFWGAFISEKLQSLYLGRPVMLQEKDAHVPKIFLDTFEEHEVWKPHEDSKAFSSPNQSGSDNSPWSTHAPRSYRGQECYSISSFRCMCGLAEICGKIISTFYAVQSPREPMTQLVISYELIRRDLNDWEQKIPSYLRIQRCSVSQTPALPVHVFILHSLHCTLTILLERPFVADGHLRSVEPKNVSESWKRCTTAALKIAGLLEAYEKAFSLRRAPYQLCYAAYVAATIIVRNASASSSSFHSRWQSTSNDSQRSPPVDRYIPQQSSNFAGTEETTPLETCLTTFKQMSNWVYGAPRLERIIRSLMARMNVTAGSTVFDERNGYNESNGDPTEVTTSSNVPSSAVPGDITYMTGNAGGSDAPTNNESNSGSANINLDAIMQSFDNPAYEIQFATDFNTSGLSGLDTFDPGGGDGIPSRVRGSEAAHEQRRNFDSFSRLNNFVGNRKNDEGSNIYPGGGQEPNPNSLDEHQQDKANYENIFAGTMGVSSNDDELGEIDQLYGFLIPT